MTDQVSSKACLKSFATACTNLIHKQNILFSVLLKGAPEPTVLLLLTLCLSIF